MPILTFREAREASSRAQRAQPFTKTAGSILNESARASEQQRIQGSKFDIFLSHSSSDAELVLGIRQLLVDRGLTVYVDWINDPQLDRSQVTPATADTLRNRMKSCKSMFFVDTDGSTSSRWMPWECGYFDAFSGSKVAIIPLRENAQNDYAGREFLGLYFYITFENSTEGGLGLWVRSASNTHASYRAWMGGQMPQRKP